MEDRGVHSDQRAAGAAARHPGQNVPDQVQGPLSSQVSAAALGSPQPPRLGAAQPPGAAERKDGQPQGMQSPASEGSRGRKPACFPARFWGLSARWRQTHFPLSASLPPSPPLPAPATMNPYLPLTLARHSQGGPCIGCREGEQSWRCTPHTSPPLGHPHCPLCACGSRVMYLRASRPRRRIRNTQN